MMTSLFDETLLAIGNSQYEVETLFSVAAHAVHTRLITGSALKFLVRALSGLLTASAGHSG